MKKIAKIFYYEDEFRYKDASDISMNILINFLISDVRNANIEYYKQWALNPWLESSGGNISDLYKEDDYIFIEDLYPEPEFKDIACKIKKSEFIKLLDEWKKHYDMKPKEILITKEGEIFNLQATY